MDNYQNYLVKKYFIHKTHQIVFITENLKQDFHTRKLTHPVSPGTVTNLEYFVCEILF